MSCYPNRLAGDGAHRTKLRQSQLGADSFDALSEKSMGRPEVYARHASETSPRVNGVVTLEEAKRRIRELGLLPELEGDYEDAGKAGD